MADFIAYSSQRTIRGPEVEGLQYNVLTWFPEPVDITVDEDIFASQTQDRLITSIKVILSSPIQGNNKSLLIRAKPVGETPSILRPGVDLCRYFMTNVQSFGVDSLTVYSGFPIIRIGLVDGQLYFPVRFYLDKTMDLNINIQDFTNQSIQIHYITGDPETLMRMV